MTSQSDDSNNLDLDFLLQNISYAKQVLQNFVDSKTNDIFIERPEYDPKNLPSLQQLSKNFNLSPFEEFVLILCAGVELDSELAKLCGLAQHNPNSTYPTFGLVLNLFPEPYLNALTPSSKLRKYKLINLYHSANSTPLTTNPILIEENILHYLTGNSYFEPLLNRLLNNIEDNSLIPLSHVSIVDKIKNIFSNQTSSIILLFGKDTLGKQSIAHNSCISIGMPIKKIDSESIPSKPEELEAFIQLWNRESILTNHVLFIHSNAYESDTVQKIKKLLSRIQGNIIISTQEREDYDLPTYAYQVNKPTKNEQKSLWHELFPTKSKKSTVFLERLVTQFDLSFATINNIIEETNFFSDDSNFEKNLWSSTCKLTTNRLSELAQEISTNAEFDDLILPDRHKKILKYIMMHVRHRYVVHETKGYDRISNRGLSVSVLFSGESGTGKTFAAEVLAKKLDLLLFRVDAASLVSKYYGETEKNIKKVFDACEDGGAILFFDEADALFGKRSDVQTSQDRNANSEINYLLQKMDSFAGILILSTNLKNAIDNGFIAGRIKYAIDFPFPDEENRKLIWKKSFPQNINTNEINFDNLAKINLNGRLIRNATILADILATDDGINITMRHLTEAIKTEYSKIGRSFNYKDMDS